MAAPPTYYRPYLPSDSELSDADSLSSQDTSPPASPTPEGAASQEESEISSLPNFASFAKALAAALPSDTSMAAGPTLATQDQELAYGTNRLSRQSGFASYPVPDISGITLATSATNKSTVVMLQSRDRDHFIFPNPTACTLQLPRNYFNITSLSIAQINLTSAFFYFSAEKKNISVQIYESDRLTYPYTANPPTDVSGHILPLANTPLKLTNTIRPGSYNIAQLLSELQTELNQTPLFYDFTNGFSDFLPLFSVNGDYSINFNYPGDTYYDSLRRTFIPNPTRAQIVSYYFQTQYANLFTYTVGQVRVAYYYPVLKEVLLDPQTDITTYTFAYTDPTTGVAMTQADIIQYVIYNFTGVNDPIVSTVVIANTTALDEYRLQHTFRYSLINRYSCSYDQTNNRITIQSTTLNTSLVSLLTTQYNSILSQQLAVYILTPVQYAALSTETTNLLSVIQAMYDYIQVNLAKYFAINYGTFGLTYFTVLTNTLLIRSGLDAGGISLRYNAAVAATPRTNDLLDDFRKNPGSNWLNMSNLGAVEGRYRNMGGVPSSYGLPTSYTFPQNLNYSYNLSQSNIDINHPFISDQGDIYTDARRSCGDILVNVEAGKYTIFQFRSLYRQTLQVETLPRQTQFRYPEYNNTHVIASNLSNLYTNYTFTEPAVGTDLYNKMTYNTSYDIIYGWQTLSNTTTNFGIGLNASQALWNGETQKIDIANSNGRFYYFQTPLPTPLPIVALTKYELNVTFISFVQSSPGVYTPAPFPSRFYAFFYQDLSAFNADIHAVRAESPFNYKYKLTIEAGTNSNTQTFKTYANEQYYLILRPDSLTPSSTLYRIVPWFTSQAYTTLTNSTDFDPFQDPSTLLLNSNVAISQDPDYLHAPIQQALWQGKDPSYAPVNNLLQTAAPAIGYDINYVSNDLTDYIPFSPFNNLSNILPGATISADPTNNFIFQLNTPYDPIFETYFPADGANAILTSNAAAPYTWTPKANALRQYKMVHYYSTHYLPDTSTALSYNPSTDISPYINPYTIYSTDPTGNNGITNYQYQGADRTLVLGAGVCGFTFLPGDGTWAIDRIVVKTNFITTSNTSVNSKIHLLGVFFTSEILSQAVSYISLQNAVAVCVKVKDTMYVPTVLNIGFDAGLGTYSTFSNVPELVTRTKFSITGFNQTSKTFISDSNAYYSVVAFSVSPAAAEAIRTKSWTTINSASLLNTAEPAFIQNLTGSLVPYPYATTPVVSATFYDGQSAYTTGQSLIKSSALLAGKAAYGPILPNDESMSQYEQSIPIINSHIHYLSPADILSQANAFSSWTNLPIQPTAIGASIPNRLLLQGSAGFSIVSFIKYDRVDLTTDPARRFTLTGSLTIQQIFPDDEVTSLLGFSGTTTDYVFAGASNIPGANYSQLRFRKYNPFTGILSELPINPAYTFSNNLQLQHFVFHNNSQWFMTSVNQPAETIVLQGALSSGAIITPKIYSGLQSELAMDPQGSYLYFAVSPDHNTSFNTMKLFTFKSSDPGYITTAGYTISLERRNGSSYTPTYYKQLSVSLLSTSEEVLFTNTDVAPTKFYKLLSYMSGATTLLSNAVIDFSARDLMDSAQNLLTPTRIVGGALGSKWILYDSPPYIQGNRYDAYDSPISLSIAWQIFFPTIKIEMRKLSSSSTPITDLTNITYPEWPRVMMFAYSNAASLSNDLSNTAYLDGTVTRPASGKWGLESSSNFMVSDPSFSGYQFNSYMMNIPLTSSNSSLYYIAIRGALPTESFQTLLRFYLPNRYDFGYIKIQDICNEIIFAKAATASQRLTFNPVYLNTLLSFTSNFSFTGKNFGSNATQGFTGVNLNSTDFGTFLAQYIVNYNKFKINTNILQTVSSNVQSGMNSFIASNLRYILPLKNQTRQRFTDPLLFQILWKSPLSSTMVTLDDEWGLGWNLGFAKADSAFSTIQIAPSFYKIQQDFIYLRLNPEFNINRLDAGGKEDYKTTRQTTGTTNQYYCKLLLTSFGGNATTFIHNPIMFNPPLYKLTNMNFQWFDQSGAVITNEDAEWNMTVSITETMFTATLPMTTDFKPNDYVGTPAPLPPGLALSTLTSTTE